jgi:hypothetical protein
LAGPPTAYGESLEWEARLAKDALKHGRLRALIAMSEKFKDIDVRLPSEQFDSPRYMFRSQRREPFVLAVATDWPGARTVIVAVDVEVPFQVEVRPKMPVITSASFFAEHNPAKTH